MLQHISFNQVQVPDRREIQTYVAGAAIAAGDFVALDLSKSTDAEKAVNVVPAIMGASPAKNVPIGVALAAASAGATVQVVVRGLAEATVAATSAGDTLVVDASTGTAGRLVTAGTTGADDVPVAKDLDGGAAGTHTVWVL